MMNRKIDFNCDLGEWEGGRVSPQDERIMPFISSCNIACGGHAGDMNSMEKTILLAKKFEVSAGAHPSFPDKKNFGREEIEISYLELKVSLKSQMSNLKSIAEKHDVKIHHIKPHGALYNKASIHRETAKCIVESIDEVFGSIKVYGQPNTEFQKAVEDSGMLFVAEFFADRAYEDNLTLRSRKLSSAVLITTNEVLAQIELLLIHSKVKTFSGNEFNVKPQTICLHSDTDGAVKLAQEIYNFVRSHGIEITAA